MIFPQSKRLIVPHEYAANMTAASSGSNGISVPNNTQVNFGTGNFTLHWEGSLPDWTPSAMSLFLYKIQDNDNRYYFGVNPNGTLRVIFRFGGVLLNATDSTAAVSLTDGRAAKISVSVVRETALTAGSITFYVNESQLGASVAITAASPVAFDSAGPLYINGSDISRYASTTTRAITFNRALSSAEVASLVASGIASADVGGSNTELTSGALTTGKKYRIKTFVSGDSFTNVGAASNASGVEFIATGTTPTTWTNSSALLLLGATASYAPSGLTPGSLTWTDSAHGNNATLPAAGASIIQVRK